MIYPQPVASSGKVPSDYDGSETDNAWGIPAERMARSASPSHPTSTRVWRGTIPLDELHTLLSPNLRSHTSMDSLFARDLKAAQQCSRFEFNLLPVVALDHSFPPTVVTLDTVARRRPFVTAKLFKDIA